MKTDINQKNLLYSGNTYRQKFTNNKIYNATEISQSTLKHINVSTADKIYIKENNRKNSLPKKSVISVKRNFYKSKVKTPITNYNKEKKGTSIQLITNTLANGHIKPWYQKIAWNKSSKQRIPPARKIE